MTNEKGNFISQGVSHFLNKAIHGTKEPTRAYNRTSRGQFKATQLAKRIVIVNYWGKPAAYFEL